LKTDTLELLLTAEEPTRGTQLNGVVIGFLVELFDPAAPIVTYPGCPVERGVRARAAARFGRDDIGVQVALMFEQGDPARPIVIGRLLSEGALAGQPRPIQAEMDGQRLVLEAKEEIVLRCGSASIHLTRAGKVLIKGAYVSTRSTGAHRIKGASVQIN
jgi:Domain of unknown function (DUF6484)